MNLIILALQIILALLFVYTGFTKIFKGKVAFSNSKSWEEDYKLSTLKFFGVLELLGAIGLTVPHLTNILPILTPVAATALAMVMAGAILAHIRREEHKMILLNLIVIFLLAGIGFERLLELYVN
ncbi:MAG: DoxX family protein [Bacteroidetes bacterium]|nr:DoxX family protein [Bacteroidota bacterium]